MRIPSRRSAAAIFAILFSLSLASPALAATVGESGGVFGGAEIEYEPAPVPGGRTARAALFSAGAETEAITVKLGNNNPDLITGFTVAAAPAGGGAALYGVRQGAGWDYKIPFASPPQEDTDFTITVTSQSSAPGFHAAGVKETVMTYNAIKSLTIRSGDTDATGKTLYLQTNNAQGRQSVQLAATKNGSGGSTGPTGYPYMKANGYVEQVLWTSSNEAVASVDATGLVTAHTGGTATVTASVYGGRVKATCTVNVSAVTGVSLSHTAYTLFTGGTAAETQFTLSAALTGGVSSDELEWTNSDPGATAMTVAADGRSATIDASGKTAGSTTITAYIKGAPDTAQYKASCTVTVVTINSLTMNPTGYTLYIPGPPQTVQLTATVTPNAAPFWSSGNPSAATVNETGLVTAVAPGSAIVTASVGGKSANCAITVKDRIAVTSVTVSGNNNLVRTSDNLSPTSQLSATTDPPNVTFPVVTWAKTGGSGNININASGLVTATAAGSATFTATVDGMTSAPYSVTVTDQKVTGITIAQKSVDKGGTVQMSATVRPANALNRNITWSLASGNVASISAAGLVTGGVGGNGTITVRASAADGSGVSGTGTVTVNGCEHALSAGGYGSGAGTSGNPWIVASAGQLQHVNSHLAGHFRQSVNIDLSSYGQWTPIGNFVSGTIDAPFTGLYDGNGKIITGCKINGGFLRGSLFGCVSGSGAGVKNLSAQNFTINVSNVNTSDTSAVVNYLMNGAVVSGCRVLNSTLTCHYSGASIVAAIYGNSRVENCYADGNTVTGTSVGGITSWMQENGAIKNCFSYSNRLTANGGALGGIAAQTFSGSPALSGNYFLNSTASYGGGNPLTNTGATPLAAAAFKNSASFSGWDFSTVWYMPANGNYPMLRHFTQ